MRPTQLFAAALPLLVAHGLFDEGWDVMTIQLK
jgi:hypothetical protein